VVVPASGDSGAPPSRAVIPIGENISSRPFHNSSDSLTPRKERDTQRDTPRRSSHVTRPLRPFDNHHNPIRSRRQSPHPSSAPRFSPIHRASRTSRTTLAPTHLLAIGDRSPQTPNTTLSSQHHCDRIDRIALWGISPSPSACATLAQEPNSPPDARFVGMHALI